MNFFVTSNVFSSRRVREVELKITNRSRRASVACRIWCLRRTSVCVLLQLVVAVLPSALTVTHQTFSPIITHTALSSSVRVNWPEDDDSFIKESGEGREQGNRQISTRQVCYLDTISLLPHTSCQYCSVPLTLFLSLVFYPLKLSPMSSDDDPFLS
jgi:hypothetical protein